MPVCPDRDLLRLLPRTDQTLVAQHRPDRDQDAVPPVARACRVCCPPVSHPGQAASHSRRGLRHHSPKHAWPQGRVLRTGRVRSAWRARLRQPPVLHQHVGHGLAHGLPGCRRLKNKAQFQLKWSLLVCSATRDAQSCPTAHIYPRVNSDSHPIHTDTCKYIHIQHACLWMQKNTDMQKIQTKYRQIHANTCTYMHIVTDLFLMYFCMYFGKIGVCMMRVFVCIACICLYFLQQKLLGASIQTHSARYMRYIQNTSKIHQKYSTNTYKYMHIHAPKFKNPLFWKRFFSVCILFVFVCIVSIFVYVVSRYMSNTLELLCACMCMYCMYVHVFVSMHFLQIASHIFLVENMFKVLPPPSHYKSFFAGWSMYVCVCIACMCMYRMYLSVWYEWRLY